MSKLLEYYDAAPGDQVLLVILDARTRSHRVTATPDIELSSGKALATVIGRTLGEVDDAFVRLDTLKRR